MAKPTRKLVPRDDRVTINHEFASVEEFITEYVSNISRSGAFIRTRHPLDVGTKVNLKFTVIMEELETIEGIGEVVRVQVDPPGMGVVFVTLTSHSQDLIYKLITRRRTAVGRSGTIPGIGGGGTRPALPDGGRSEAEPLKALAPAPRATASRPSVKPPPPPPEAMKSRKK